MLLIICLFWKDVYQGTDNYLLLKEAGIRLLGADGCSIGVYALLFDQSHLNATLYEAHEGIDA